MMETASLMVAKTLARAILVGQLFALKMAFPSYPASFRGALAVRERAIQEFMLRSRMSKIGQWASSMEKFLVFKI